MISIAEKGGAGNAVRVVGSVCIWLMVLPHPLSPELVRDGLILEPKAVAAAINDLFKATGVSKERVITSLTGLPFTYRILSLPRMKPALLEEAI